MIMYLNNYPIFHSQNCACCYALQTGWKTDISFVSLSPKLAAASISSSLVLCLSPSPSGSSSFFVLDTLVDSGSTHCFVDTRIVKQNKVVETRLTTPTHLCLFDGSTSSKIVSTVLLDCTFPNGFRQSIDFFITTLDSSVSAVLGHSWLTCTNLQIDWASGQVILSSPELPSPPPSLPEFAMALVPPMSFTSSPLSPTLPLVELITPLTPLLLPPASPLSLSSGSHWGWEPVSRARTLQAHCK